MIIDLISSQSATKRAALDSLFSAPKGDTSRYSIDEVGKMTQGLIDAFTQESISGFEREKAIVKLHEQLQSATGIDRFRILSELKNAKAQVYIQRNDFMRMVSDFQGVCGAVAAFASPEVANQVHVISSHFINIGTQVAGLAGYGPLAAEGAVTPVGFGSAILTAIGQVSSLFRKQKGITFERATMEAIAVLSQQIHQLREEMHRRFDEIQFQLFMMNSDIMIQFGLLHQEAGQIAEKLEHIHRGMASNHSQLQHTLSSINQSITDLAREFTDSETQREVRKLSELINPVLYNISAGYMTYEEFSKLSNQLLAAIHISTKQKELAGSLINLPDGEIAKWQPVKHSGLWVNYQINSIRAYAAATMGHRLEAAMSNPILLCYASMALILINRRRYSTSADPLALHISKTEMQKINEVVAEFSAVQEALIPLREPKLYIALLGQIKTSALLFQQAYEKVLATFQTQKSEGFELATRQAQTKQQAHDIQEFNSQKIEPNWKGGEYRYEWFRAESRVSDGSFSNTCVPSLNSGMGTSTAGQSISARDKYVKTIEDEFQASTKKYERLGANVMYPAPGCPGKLLPITPELIARILKTLSKDVQHAVELNKLQLKFEYFTKDNTEFHLQLWIEDRLCYSVCLPYQMPIYTPGESEWLFWVGGTRPIGGVDTVQFGGGSHKRCSWVNQIYIPKTSKEKGCIDTFSPDMGDNRAKRVDIDAINTLANQFVTETYKMLREEFNESVRQQFESDHKSALGKAIVAFDANFKRLKALLALAFPDVYSQPHDLYRLVHGSNLPLSRHDWLDYLANNPSLLGNELFMDLKRFISLLETRLPPLVTSLRSTASNQLLGAALNELQDLLDEYRPTAVDRNEVVPVPRGMQEHDVRRADALRIAQLEATLTAYSRTVNGLPPHMAQTFNDETLRNLTTIVEEHPHLMGAAATPNSFARMISGSGGPVFSTPSDDATRRSLPSLGDCTQTFKPS